MYVTRTQSPPKVRVFLQQMAARGELVPGADDTLSKLGAINPDTPKCMSDLVAYLHRKGKAYLTRRGRKVLENTPTLLFILERLQLREGSADALYDQWAADMATYKPGQAASAVMTRLDQPGMAYHFRPKGGELTRAEQRVRAAFHVFKDHFRPKVKFDELAQLWAEEFGNLPFNKIVQAVAFKLESPAIAFELLDPEQMFDSEDFRGWYLPYVNRSDEDEIVDGILQSIKDERQELINGLRRLNEQLAKVKMENEELDRREREWEEAQAKAEAEAKAEAKAKAEVKAKA